MRHWGPVWGKDETTRFQNDAVRDDLRLGAEGKQVVEQLGGQGRGGEGRVLSPKTSKLEGVGRQRLQGPREEGPGAWNVAPTGRVYSTRTTVDSLFFFLINFYFGITLDFRNSLKDGADNCRALACSHQVDLTRPRTPHLSKQRNHCSDASTNNLMLCPGPLQDTTLRLADPRF